ncbi:MAG: SMP-30/gluconolactonase/LRE family protein [Saprospiraceae bacterium]
MRTLLILVLAISFITSCGLTPESTAGGDATAAPKVSDFTPPNAFTEGIEGPATDAAGNIYAVNFKEQGTIGKVTPEGKASLFATLPEGSTGNGIRIGKDGGLYIADYSSHNVLHLNPATMTTSVFAHSDEANQPNDLAIAPNGTLYTSDPNWADSTGQLWKVTSAGFELLEKDMGTTNGIEVSPDGSKLYVNESVQRNLWVYDIQADGGVSNKQLLHHFSDFGLDGMRCMPDGRLFVTRHGKGTVVVLSPEGMLLTEISLKGQKPTNLTFSPDYGKCYVTLADRGCIEVIDLVSTGGLSEEEQELLELLPVVL